MTDKGKKNYASGIASSYVNEIAGMNYTSSYCTSTWYRTLHSQDSCGLSILLTWIIRNHVPQTVPKKIIDFVEVFKISKFCLIWNGQRSTVLEFCRGSGPEK